MVRRSRADPEGVRRRPCGRRGAPPGRAPPRALPPLRRVRRQAPGPPARGRRLGRLGWGGRRGGWRPGLARRSDGEAAERARDSAVGVFTRSGGEPTETVAQAGAAGGARGAGVGAAGGLAKLAGVGAVPQAGRADRHRGGGHRVVATGLAPMHLPTTTERAEVEQAPAERPAHHGASSRPLTLPSQVGHEVAAPAPGPRPAPPPETVHTPIEPEPAPAPPVQQEFGLAPAGAAGSGSASLGAGGAGASSGGGDSGAVTQEFGP